MMKHPNLICRSQKGIFLLAQTEQNPSNEEWESIIAEIQNNPGEPPKAVLISSEGGSPNAIQRKRLRDTLQGRQSSGHAPQMAMFSESSIVRVALTALRAFISNAPVAFSTKQWREASLHLRLSQEEMQQAIQALNELRSELNLPPLPTPK